MLGGLRIHVDVDDTGRYRFRVRADTAEIATEVTADLAASFYEDLRLLRWKSVGLRKTGDVLLNHVGERLAGLIAPPATWEELGLQDEARYVRIEFSQAAHALMPFPWELLRVNNHFLIGARGSHLVRDVPTAAARKRRRNPRMNVLHLSLGTDNGLRFDEERCKLLETIPENMPIEFLIDPPLEHIRSFLDTFRPHIIIVSGHGHYDDISREHLLTARDGTLLRASAFVAGIPSYGCELLVLSTCESARLGGHVIDDGTPLPADLIAFSFPVESATATQGLACLLEEIVRGKTIDEALASARAIDTEDEYAFFNTVHLHRKGARSLQLTNTTPPSPGPRATRCPGMESTLCMLNGVAHADNPVTVVAPVGGGGDTLVQHWAELIQRSQTKATRWRVLRDGVPLLDVPGAQLVRLVYPYSFVPVTGEIPVYCDGIDRERSLKLLSAHSEELARQVDKHPLLAMPGFVDDLITGRTTEEAVERFERDNRMAERAGRLSRDGVLFASWLFTNQSVAQTAFEDRAAFAEKIKDFGMEEATVVAGIENAVAATVVLPLFGALILAPEFMLLGERWFPNWRTDHRPVFELLCSVFAVLAPTSESGVEADRRLLDWATRLEEWRIAARICIHLCQWHGRHGRLEEMKETIERLVAHATGMERIVLRGHLTTIALQHGDFSAGLALHHQIEIDLQSLRDDDDYVRNMQATITQQVDCLINLGRLEEAERRWQEAEALLPELGKQRPEAEARMLGQLAHLRREQDRPDDAIDAASKAVQLALDSACSAVLVAELRHTKADQLRRAGRDREAVQELNAMAAVPMPPTLRSRFLHLKGLLLERYNAPNALEHLLESYQQDLLRDDKPGVAISLLGIARTFFEQGDYDRARERIQEALPRAETSGLPNLVASLALLAAQIAMAKREASAAATWLIMARDKFTEGHDEGGVAHANELLNTLRDC